VVQSQSNGDPFSVIATLAIVCWMLLPVGLLIG
jgi:hypothetical protein